ncbi:hypothetical protein AQUCO_02200156v1 [Aquilegia coerulea]|uniref:F-box domain-containing protein n=1 Tax=Aquilegia coerulea TaxID=218851 RepID=A0A2G5DDH7_AQUCA|nr:hypothetical protein AQUCO_02200156v1 [Aquilegia coerulea]PIA41531.1 hypothetical protein AQUCO_02200156v1 [Aquilegia coerulea]PIA41532.1 hypothetical protein AQUCO_02200156v1 [Aquilegia coerulea]
MDRISYLPEEIQSQIVSYLTTEEAVRTSILSRQWRKVVTTLSCLYFNQILFQREEKRTNENFKDFVYQTLDHIHDNSDIQKMRLDVKFEDAFVPHINEWKAFAVSHSVRELVLNIYFHKAILEELPLCLFTCKSLTSLTLKHVVLVLPTTVEFINLKALTLMFVAFSDENVPDKLFASCSVLEHLEIIDCYLKNLNVLTISAPKLKFLDFYSFNFVREIKFSYETLNQIIYRGNVLQVNSGTFVNLCNASFTFVYPPKSMRLYTYDKEFERQVRKSPIKLLADLPKHGQIITDGLLC